MTEPLPRKPSTRERRPTQRLNEYDRAQGRLTTLSKSVGRKETPPTAESRAAEQAKMQAIKAASRGNTSRPGPLAPLTVETLRGDEEDEEMDQLEEDEDEEAGPSLLEYRLEDLDNEVDRVEWLYQTLAKLGSRRNYRDDPKFQDERSLRKEWKRLLAKGSEPHGGAAGLQDGLRICTGSTHVLEPPTSGRSSRIKLIRTDESTLGLDGLPAGAHCHLEYGQAPPPKLARTDSTTIGLDGKAASPYSMRPTRPDVSAHSTRPARPAQPTPANSSRPAQSTSTKRTHTDDPGPSKKRVVVPRSRIEALRKENAKPAAAPPPAPSSTAARRVSNPVPKPPSPPPLDVEIGDPPSDGDQPLTPPSDQDEVDLEPGDQGDKSEPEIAAEPVQAKRKRAKDGKLTKRQKQRLSEFPSEARDLIQWMTDEIKLDSSTICPFPECMREDPKDPKTYFDRWIVIHWERANARFRAEQAPLPFHDDYAGYIRNQLPANRFSLKSWADALVKVHFGLHRSDPTSAATAKSLTYEGDERWVSPNLKKDDKVFRHPIIADLIEQEFFKNRKSFGYKHLKRFTPLCPVPMIAYACAMIRISIKALESKDGTCELNAMHDKDDFTLYMQMLDDLRDRYPARLLNIRAAITRRYLTANPQPTAIQVPEMNLGPDAEIDMEALEMIRDRLGSEAPEIDDWDGVSDVGRKRKGKAAMRGGASGSNH
ncbi:hypothetical protein RhiJN_23460 [Ceratobasidium sp. AG-Ba]|nr:hypothetical protein RhiJN_23460 [Ceratobasidium sp. AG-Ba]